MATGEPMQTEEAPRPTRDLLWDDLSALLNRYSQENESDTPDFILATYMLACLEAFNAAVFARSNWYDHHSSPGNP